MAKRMIHNADDLERTVLDLGFLPFFKNSIEGFSVEELTSPELWFEDGVDGPWEWKGPVIRNWKCTYGKFFGGRAGFVSLEWFPDFANYRRSCHPLENTLPNSNEHNREQVVYDTVVANESLLSKEIKNLCGFRKPKGQHLTPVEKEVAKSVRKSQGVEGFETVLTRLQMATWIVIADFEYQYDKQGRTYGWGVARYTTPEALFGDRIALLNRTPEESKTRILHHLNQLLPSATEKQLVKFIG